MKYERYIMIALLAAVWFGALDTPLYYLNNIVWELLGKGTGYIDKIAYSIYYAGLGRWCERGRRTDLPSGRF